MQAFQLISTGKHLIKNTLNICMYAFILFELTLNTTKSIKLKQISLKLFQRTYMQVL